MALKKFKIVSQTFIDYDADFIGVVKDTYINDKDATKKTYNYGGSSYLYCGHGVNGNQHIIIELQMPEDSDFINFDGLIKVELMLYVDFTTLPDTLIIGVVSIDDIWVEGTGNDDVGVCNWTDKLIGPVLWTNAGAIKSRFGAINADDGVIYDTKNIVASGLHVLLDLTTALNMGEKKTFVIFPISSSIASPTMYFDSKQHATSSCRPKLKLTYKDYATDAFSDKDSALLIEPNPNNPEQPLLKWGGVKDTDFVDFKLYRETSPITTVSGKTPIATITSPADQEYIDTYAHVDGTTYYYLVIAEDGNNTLDDATKSNQIEWKKPNMTVRTVATAGSSPVGTTKTVSVTSSLPIKRLYVNWEDGCASWYEFETVGLTKTATHIYSKVLGLVGSQFAPKTRVEDENGFWSSQLGTTTTIYITDTNPTAKLRVSVKKGMVGDYVTLDASLSQPSGSNITIDEYYFKRYAADSYHGNGTNPVYPFHASVSEGFEALTYTATVKVITSSGKEDTDTATYDLETGTATELDFSQDTKIHEWNHDLSLDKLVEVPIGSDRVAHEFLISRPPERVTLVGTSNHPNVGTDIALIRGAWLSNTFVKFVIKSEMEGKTVTYEGKIDGDISLGQSYDYKQSWTFPLRVITRTVQGTITKFANGGGGSVIVTSNDHTLIVGNTVVISGTTNYNGSFIITAITKNTFTITDTWVSDDGTGTWKWAGT